MPNKSQEIDSNSRDKIIKEIKKNFFVIANAGSGKTTILVNRMVAMVEAGIDVSQICAITFTVNAAAEFFSRFQEALKDRSVTPDSYEPKFHGDLPKTNELKRSRCKEALKNINLCFLGTIDSFCNKVISEFPLDAGVPSSSSIIEKEDLLKLYKKVYEEISRSKESPYYESFCNFAMLNKDAADVFSNAISDVIDGSILPLQYKKPNRPLKDVFEEFRAKYEKKIKKDILELINCGGDVVLFNGSGKDTNKYVELFDAFQNSSKRYLKPWTISNFMDILKELRKKIFKTDIESLRFNSVPNTEILNFKIKTYKKGKTELDYAIYDSTDDILGNILKELDDIKYSYSIHFLYSISKDVNDKLRKLGKLTYTDYLIVFRNMLLKDMEGNMNIINHIRSKYAYFLLDESQDTSPFQTELFMYLTSTTKALRVEDCRPIPGSLFILGDPKQSIYRFRCADVNSYLKTKNLFENVFDPICNEVLWLTMNFRSTDLLKEYFNKTFKDMKNYEEIPSSTGIGGTSGLFTYTDYVGAIKTMLGNEKYMVMAKEGNKKELRAPKYKDFMIITKNKAAIVEVINKLNENNIPLYVEGTIDISTPDFMKTIYAIYRYIVYKDSLGSLSNLLVCPLFNLSYDKAIGITTSNIPKELKPYFELIDSIDEMDPIVLYEKIIDNVQILKNVSYYNMDYAYYVLEKMKDAYLNAEINDLTDAVDYMDSFISSYPERVMSMEYKPNAVHLANLHKVKGLEAPIVLLKQACVGGTKTCKFRNDYDNNKSYIFKTDEHEYNGNKIYYIVTNAYKDEEELEKEEMKLEDERLKYVAATRARSYLLIDNSKGKNNANSFWDSLVNDDFNPFEVVYSENNDNNDDDKIELDKLSNGKDVLFNESKT